MRTTFLNQCVQPIVDNSVVAEVPGTTTLEDLGFGAVAADADLVLV